MTKKNKKDKKPKKIPVYRTHEERQEESKKIISSLNRLDLTIHYPAVKKLFENLKDYIENGHRIMVNIPFPEQNRRIKGVLADNKHEEVWIRLEYEEF